MCNVVKTATLMDLYAGAKKDELILSSCTLIALQIVKNNLEGYFLWLKITRRHQSGLFIALKACLCILSAWLA